MNEDYLCLISIIESSSIDGAKLYRINRSATSVGPVQNMIFF